ncbi:14-3-3 domain-containing protein [Talaromyces proteolyticus]|uniref:14-3-3 domain-containing protein n=1 Tax=Talaromyces proteolyticus TaxID=1131652 RepID=A0AAD4Q0L4_9EURO|nr:14-3-3 domain-containing protein [Talaromyces proteolyticus]KAH8697381.1 14-3-3 domain-containing protein [Talaromyces proteolyticus]
MVPEKLADTGLEEEDEDCQEDDDVLDITDLDNLLQELDVSLFAIWMASHEVDQKYLAHLALATKHENPFLSSMLYKILGLSVILSKKLLRARKLRRLDPTRETKSLQLYHHIVWLSREGLVIVEQYILPMVQDYIELKVLAYKLRASFYHIFVLFHNQPAIHTPGISSLPSSSNLQNGNGFGSTTTPSEPNRASITTTPPPTEGGPVRNVTQGGPPGLPPVQSSKFTASFLLPALDYTLTATPCFAQAAALADTLLPGSHPLRLSVKLEYAAYLYDCLHDADSCRRLAKQTIADVYNAQEGMDDESFEDAAELVAVLGRMVRRGGKTSSAGGSSTTGRDHSRSNDGQSIVSNRTPPRPAPLTPTKQHTPPHHRTPNRKSNSPTPTRAKPSPKPSPTSSQLKTKAITKQSPSTASRGSTTPKAPVPIINPI